MTLPHQAYTPSVFLYQFVYVVFPAMQHPKGPCLVPSIEQLSQITEIHHYLLFGALSMNFYNGQHCYTLEEMPS